MAEQAIGPAARAGLCLAGRYRLEAVIATGGMGSVWSAEDTFLGREVAGRRSRWRSMAVALSVALTLAAVLQGTGTLQSLVGTRGMADPSPAIEAPLGGSGLTGAAPFATGEDHSSSQGQGSGGHGDDSSDAPDHRSSSGNDQGGSAGDGGDQRDHDDDGGSGPGRGGSS